MKLENNQTINGDTRVYVSPLLEVIEVKIERGFAVSNGGSEGWNETPGGGDF